MDLDNSWFGTDIAADVFETMRSQERAFSQFENISLGNNRDIAIKWMLNLADNISYQKRKFILDQRTIHLAVRLYDSYLSSSNCTSVSRFLPLAATALVLAAKFEGTIAAAIVASLPNLLKERIWIMERNFLRTIGWRLMVPTPALFVPYFMATTNGKIHTTGPITRQNMKRRNVNNTVIEYWYLPETYLDQTVRRKVQLRKCEYFESLVYHLCRYSLKSWIYRPFKPTEIAAGAVAAARFCINAAPTWPSSIADLTNYLLSDLYDCVHFMLRDFDHERRRDAALFPHLLSRGDFALLWIEKTRSLRYPLIPAPLSLPSFSPTCQNLRGNDTQSFMKLKLGSIIMGTFNRQAAQIAVAQYPTVLMLATPTCAPIPMICTIPNAYVIGPVVLVDTSAPTWSENSMPNDGSNEVQAAKRMKFNEGGYK